MPNTNAIRNAVSTLFPDNQRGVIRAKNVRDGFRLIADTIDKIPPQSWWLAMTQAEFEAFQTVISGALSQLGMATELRRFNIVTEAGVRDYSRDSEGQLLNLTQDNHVLFGGAPYGPLTYGIDYHVLDGNLSLLFDPADDELLTVVSMPRLTNSEAQVVLQDYRASVADLVTDVEDATVRAELAAERAEAVFGNTYAFVPFTSHADIALANIPAPIIKISLLVNGLILELECKAGGTAATSADGAKWDPVGDAYPEHFAAIGDGTTLEDGPMQKWGDFLRKNGRAGRLNARSYVVSTLEMMPEKFYSITGDNFHLSEIVIRNTSRTAVGINFGHVDGNTRPPFGVRLDSIRVRAGAGTKACLVQFARSIDLQIFRFKVTAFHGATGIRYYGLWNCDSKEVTVYGAGHHVPTKTLPLEARFSINNGSTTLTSNIDVFDASDVGRHIMVLSTSQNAGQRHTIKTFVNARSVIVEDAQVGGNQVDGLGNFSGVTALTTAGGNTVNISNLTSDDVGRVIYIIGAGQIAGVTAPVPHRAVITNVAGNVITIDRPTPVAVNWGDVIFDPAVDIGEPDAGALNQKTNDASFQDLHIELHRGCGLVVYGARITLDRVKLHGYNMNGVSGHNNEGTNIQMLVYDTNAQINGAFEQAICGRQSRILLCGVKGITLSYAETLAIHRIPLIQHWVDSRVPVDIGTVTYYGNTSDAAMDGMIGPGWFSQYGYTTSSGKPGKAKKHGYPIASFP